MPPGMSVETKALWKDRATACCELLDNRGKSTVAQKRDFVEICIGMERIVFCAPENLIQLGSISIQNVFGKNMMNVQPEAYL